VGAVTRRRADLGSITTAHYDKVKRKDRWVLIQDKVGHHSRNSEPAGWLECGSREPGQDGSKGWSTKSHGPSF